MHLEHKKEPDAVTDIGLGTKAKSSEVLYPSISCIRLLHHSDRTLISMYVRTYNGHTYIHIYIILSLIKHKVAFLLQKYTIAHATPLSTQPVGVGL